MRNCRDDDMGHEMDLTTRAKEPVRIPGSTQPHGLLLGLTEADLAIRRTGREFAHIDEELTRKNSETDSFAYIVAHDLKEPLRGLHFHAKTLLRDYGPALDEKGRRKLARVQGLAERLTGLVDSLLVYSRAGLPGPRLALTDLNPVVAGVLELFAPAIEETKTKVEIPRPLPRVVCDPLRIGGVYNNLLSNALKYNDKPDRRIVIGHDDPAPGDTQVTLWVRDNGIGFDERHVEDVFLTFRRLHDRDEWGGGSGLGLALVKKIVERHGGRVSASGMPGKGTTISFTLPMRVST